MADRLIESPGARSIVGATGQNPLFAWITGDAHEEKLFVWRESMVAPSEVIRGTALGRPSVCCSGEWSYVACAVDRGRGFELLLFRLARDGAIEGPCPISEVRPWPGEVALCPSAKDDVQACWEDHLHEGVHLRSARVGPELEVGEVLDITPRGGAHLSPRLVRDGERMCLAWLSGRSRSGPWHLRVVDLARPRVPLFCSEPTAIGIGGLAASAARPGRLWLAWHTDRRPGRAPDLTRWIEVICIEQGKVHVPEGSPPRAEWGKLGEDQGLEFPMLVAHGDGGATLLARSSHRWWKFDLRREGWSAPEALDKEGWGCRSRSTAFVPLADGGLCWARREKDGVAINEIARAPLRAVPRLRILDDRAITSAEDAESATPRYLRPRHRRMGKYILCFGDIHQHTAHSDGLGTAREAYERARDRYRDDFCSVTDHEDFLGKQIGPGEWRDLGAVCDLFDEPGRFVTIPGYEWTGRRHPGPGHRCVYLPESEMPLLGREHPEAATSAGLIRAVERLGGLVFPHHVGWTGADADVHDPRVQTCWEIVSVHGAYEARGVGPIGQRDVPLEGHFIRDQLEQGLRFGFVGGTDGHGLLWHHGIAHRRDSHRTGLTAVLIEELTREAIFDALRNRRCYATSGVKMVLDLRVDGRPMGSEIEASDDIEVQVLVDAPSPLARADLVLSMGRTEPIPVTGSRARARVLLRWRRDEIDYFYLRAEQLDGDIGWTSPVWCSRP